MAPNLEIVTSKKTAFDLNPLAYDFRAGLGFMTDQDSCLLDLGNPSIVNSRDNLSILFGTEEP
jgi:hypothetical protein